jgi:predicted TIM-barrel fold metal-dependent hydrolase
LEDPVRVINCHAHFHGRNEVEEKRALWDSLGYIKVCMSFQNEEVLKLAQRYPDYIIPFYHLNLDAEGADDVARAREQGFVGLKLIGPKLPYSHESYFPVYERAQDLNMPMLLHTGFLSFEGGRGVRQENLQPTHLITMATYFPELRMVGAHLGNQWPMEAVAAMEYCPNIWYDMSGGTIRNYPASWFRWLFERVDRNETGQRPKVSLELVGKLVFGSDNPDDTMDFYRNFMAALEIPAEVQQKVYYDNAVEWLGM